MGEVKKIKEVFNEVLNVILFLIVNTKNRFIIIKEEQLCGGCSDRLV